MESAMGTMIQSYLESRKIKGFSPGTILLYRGYLNKFAHWLTVQNLQFNRIGLEALHNYAAWLQTQTFTQMLDIVKQFYRHCQTKERILFDPAAKLELPRYPKNPPKNISTPEQVKLLLAAPKLTSLLGLRDRAMIGLTYDAGLRIGEVVGLNRENVDFANGLLRVIGKGQKERVVPFGKPSAHYLKLYLKASHARNQANPALFQTRQGGRMQTQSLRFHFNQYNRRLGFHFTYHSLRHACALHMLQNNANIRQIQELLGHQEITTTQIYTKLLPLDLKKAHQLTHPREKEAPRHG
jgi:integrase/recombinase XerD